MNFPKMKNLQDYLCGLYLKATRLTVLLVREYQSPLSLWYSETPLKLYLLGVGGYSLEYDLFIIKETLAFLVNR